MLCSGICDNTSFPQGQIRISSPPIPSSLVPISTIPSVLQQYSTLSIHSNSLHKPIDTSAYTIANSPSIYFGPILDNRPHGIGKLTNTDGSLFQGQFKNGVANGDQCLYIYPDRSYYQGGIKNSKAEGEGKFVLREKELIYEGGWKSDLPHGHGIQQLKDGSRYQGEFVLGVKQGNGVFIWENGDIYDGEFREGMIFGHGKFESKEKGYKYQGDWENNQKNGWGVEKFDDGTKVECNFESNERIGNIVVEKEGNRYTGKEVQNTFIYL